MFPVPVPIPDSFKVDLEVVEGVAFWSRLLRGVLAVEDEDKDGDEDAVDEAVAVIVVVLAIVWVWVWVWDIIVGLVRILVPVLVLVPVSMPLCVPVPVLDFLLEDLYPIGAKDSREGSRFNTVLVFEFAADGACAGGV